MKKFKRLRSVRKSASEQGLIFYSCLCYRNQPPTVRQKIDNLCKSVGGEYAPALREYMTTLGDWNYICDKHHISASTLDRLRRDFYNRW